MVHLLVEFLVVGHRIDLLALRKTRLAGGADEIRHGNPRDFRRVLESQKEPGPAPLVDLKFEEILPVHANRSTRHLVVLVTGNDLGKGGLAGPVRSHDGVYFAGGNFEAQALENIVAVNGGVEICDNQTHLKLGRDRSRMSVRNLWGGIRGL